MVTMPEEAKPESFLSRSSTMAKAATAKDIAACIKRIETKLDKAEKVVAEKAKR